MYIVVTTMEFLNENFTSVEDLKKIDDIVNSLNEERDRIQKLVLERDLGAISSARDESKAVEIIQHLELIISDFQAGTISIDQCERELLDMIDQYGDLSKIRDHLTHLNEIRDYNKNLQLIQSYEPLYDELTRLETLELKWNTVLPLLEHFKQSRDHFDTQFEDSEIKFNIIKSMDQQVSEIINSRVKPFFMELETPQFEDFKSLLSLQEFDAINRDAKPLWCLQLLIRDDFEMRFKFHYESNQETNKLDKPEWIFKFVQEWITKNLDTLNVKFSRIFQNTHYDTRSFKEECVHAITEILKHKLSHNIELTLAYHNEDSRANLFMHLLEEMLKNDDYFVRNFQIGSNLVDSIILSSDKITSAWLDYELKFNFAKFNKIISHDDAFGIDYDSVDHKITKPTNSAILVRNLLNNLTLKYKLIRNLNFNLKLLASIQLRILERYFERLEELLDAFQSLFKRFKIIKGSRDDEVLITGEKGLENLLKIYCSVAYMIESMKVWDQDLLFIQLSNLIKEETFFKSLITSYQSLLGKVVKLLDEFFNREINTCLRQYFNVSHWSDLDRFEDVMTLELQNGLSNLTPLLDSVRKTLSAIDQIPILVNFEEKFIGFFQDNLLNFYTFNLNGAMQIEYDLVNAIQSLELFDFVKSYSKMLETLRFLNAVDQNDMSDIENEYKFKQLCIANDFKFLISDHQLLLKTLRRRVW